MGEVRIPTRTEDGERVDVIETTEMIDVGTKDDPGATIPGMVTARLATGERVNYVDARTYKTLDGRLLHRI